MYQLRENANTTYKLHSKVSNRSLTFLRVSLRIKIHFYQLLRFQSFVFLPTGTFFRDLAQWRLEARTLIDLIGHKYLALSWSKIVPIFPLRMVTFLRFSNIMQYYEDNSR